MSHTEHPRPPRRPANLDAERTPTKKSASRNAAAARARRRARTRSQARTLAIIESMGGRW